MLLILTMIIICLEMEVGEKGGGLKSLWGDGKLGQVDMNLREKEKEKGDKEFK